MWELFETRVYLGYWPNTYCNPAVLTWLEVLPTKFRAFKQSAKFSHSFKKF